MNNKKLLFTNRPIFRIPAVLVISAVIVLSALRPGGGEFTDPTKYPTIK
jgi:hypothetical protein